MAAEGLLNDLSEKTGQYDVVRLQRTLLQMNRAFGWFEGINKLWRLASMEQASGAPVSKWVSRELREGQPHLFSLRRHPRQRTAGEAAVAQGAACGAHLRHATVAEQL